MQELFPHGRRDLADQALREFSRTTLGGHDPGQIPHLRDDARWIDVADRVFPRALINSRISITPRFRA